MRFNKFLSKRATEKLILTIFLVLILPVAAIAVTIKPHTSRSHRTKTTKLNKSKLRSKQLLRAGRAHVAKEKTLGTDPSKRGKKPRKKGPALRERVLPKAKTTQSVILKRKMLPSAGSLHIKRKDYFKAPIKIQTKKPASRNSGVRKFRTTTKTIKPESLRSPKVNYSIIRKIRRLQGKKPLTTQKNTMQHPAIAGNKIPSGPLTIGEDKRPDVAITNIQYLDRSGRAHNFSSVDKSSKGKWLRFRVIVKNRSKHEEAKAYRVDVTAEHINGREWPTKDVHIVSLAPGSTHSTIVEVLIPQTAIIKSGHKIKFYADKQRVNADRNSNNNYRELTFTLLPPVEPELYFKNFSREKVASHNDYGPFSRGWIEYKYNVEIGNRGLAKANRTIFALKVQKVDHRDDNPAPYLYKDWSFIIPSLNMNQSHSLKTDKFKVYVRQTCRVDAMADSDNRIIEPNKNNNHRSSEFNVSVSNPFSGTFLAGLWESSYDNFITIGDAVFDGVNWAYKGIIARSQYALSSILATAMIGWVEAGHATHKNLARHLTPTEKTLLRPMFPEPLINAARVQMVSEFVRPELWGDGLAVNFDNVIVAQNGKLTNKYLVHEMVHSYQYKKLGIANFCWRYVYTYVKTGFNYEEISLEKQAYGFQRKFKRHEAGRIEEYLGY